jgi:hypothetical protein
MSTPEEMPAGSAHDTRSSDGSAATRAGRSDVLPVEKLELAVKRAVARVRRALVNDDETRAQLVEVLEQLSALQAKVGEWQELHHLLHQLCAAFSPFYTNLRALGDAEVEPTTGRALLQSWRPCQAGVDRLRDLEGGVAHIQLPHHAGKGHALLPDWGARIAALSREVEDRLMEQAWNTEGLIDLADELDQACDSYLSFTEHELGRAVETVQRLHTHLLGGLS